VIEFLIKPMEDDWFAFPSGSDPYRPVAMPYSRAEGSGDARIKIDRCEISFSYEDPGVQVTFEGQITAQRAVAVAEEIRQRIEQVSGQRAMLVQIPGERAG
jgi:hypothetical protein